MGKIDTGAGPGGLTQPLGPLRAPGTFPHHPPSGLGCRNAQESELLGLNLALPYDVCEAMDKFSLPLSIHFSSINKTNNTLLIVFAVD